MLTTPSVVNRKSRKVPRCNQLFGELLSFVGVIAEDEVNMIAADRFEPSPLIPAVLRTMDHIGQSDFAENQVLPFHGYVQRLSRS